MKHVNVCLTRYRMKYYTLLQNTYSGIKNLNLQGNISFYALARYRWYPVHPHPINALIWISGNSPKSYIINFKRSMLRNLIWSYNEKSLLFDVLRFSIDSIRKYDPASWIYHISSALVYLDFYYRKYNSDKETFKNNL